ncbi:MAG: hypothetical protein EA376_08605 [Phycisphaeraceae bacterium]|nr:MAG: hypothetical protein EA376_08605 [Phycisphaeraceae bacterium]
MMMFGSEPSADEAQLGLNAIAEGAGNAETPPEGTGNAGQALVGLEAGDPTSPGRKPGMQSGLMVLALVVAVAGGVLIMMRQYALQGGLQFVNVNIDYPIGAGDKRIADDLEHDRVMSGLRRSELLVQIPLEEIQRNPFQLGEKPEETVTVPDTRLSEAEILRRQREQRDREVRATLSALRLNSIISGHIPIARISGRPYRIGDTVADVFIIRSIHARSVDLDADGEIFTLSIGER